MSFLVCAFATLPCALGQNGAKQVTGVSAQFSRSVRSTALQEGDEFFLRTAERWQNPGCLIAEKTEIFGRVLSVARTGADPRKQSVTVRFAPVRCQGNPELRMVPLLVALQGYKPPEDNGLRRLGTAQAEDAAIATMFSPARPGVPTSADTLLTSANAVSTTDYDAYRRVGPEGGDLTTGDVKNLRGLTLELPGKTAATTMVFTRAVTLKDYETLALFALVPEQVLLGDTKVAATTTATVRTMDSIQRSTAQRVRPAAVETEVCAAGGCKYLASSATGMDNKAVWSVPLAQLGYQARPEQRLRALSQDASVHFLGSDEVLLTFTLHTLIRRQPQNFPNGRPRRVRGVLLSRVDGHVLKVKDWDVPDSAGPYLWELDGEHLLAQQGEDLVVLGPELEVKNRFSLPGALAFVSPAPDGGLLLLATVHEKHTAEETAALAKFLGPDEPIDENYDLFALDAQLHVMNRRLVYTLPRQPAMQQSDMVFADQGKEGQWQVSRTTWSGTRTVLAKFASACPVRVRSLPVGRVLVQGCVPNQLRYTWFRVLDGAGATLLKGEHNSYAFMQEADMDAHGQNFVTASVQTDTPLDFSVPVRAGAFTNEGVTIYKAATGKLLFARQLRSGSPEEQSVALSPEGDAVAVFTTDDLEVYRVSSGVASTSEGVVAAH